jgi:hypothetical protein
VLTVSGLTGLLTQVPAGELIDMTQSKRALVGAGIAALSLALLIFVLRPDLPSISRSPGGGRQYSQAGYHRDQSRAGGAAGEMSEVAGKKGEYPVCLFAASGH